MLNAKNLRSIRLKKKYAAKFVGLFVIAKRIGRQAYQLKLTPNYKAIHYTFYVSLLEPYQRGEDVQPPLEEIEGEEEQEVKEILNKRIERDSTPKWHIKWKGQSDTTTQEPAEHLRNAQDIVKTYKQQEPRVPQRRLLRKRGQLA